MHWLQRLWSPPARRWGPAAVATHEAGAVIPFVAGGTEVPQGLAHDATRGEFVYTFYDEEDPTVGTIVFAAPDGTVSARAPLSGLNHYGGVTLVGRLTYVCGAGRVQVHETDRLRRGVSEPIWSVPVRASSTVTSDRGDLWVARFRRDAPGRMYRYRLAADGRPVATEDALTVPPRTQGVAFAGDGVHFSCSWGRSNPSVLIRVSVADLVADGGWTRTNGRDTPLPPMAEGSVVVDGRLHQLYESGATSYRRHRRAHLLATVVLGRLDPRERLTVHDVGAVETRGTDAECSP